MRSATDFLPAVISTLTNLERSWLPNFGSGRTSRLGTSLRLGISIPQLYLTNSELRFFRTLRTVLGAGLLAILDTSRIQAAAHHVITHTRQVLHTTAADQNHAVLLQVVTFAADVGEDRKSTRLNSSHQKI